VARSEERGGKKSGEGGVGSAEKPRHEGHEARRRTNGAIRLHMVDGETRIVGKDGRRYDEDESEDE
jgi:hypothetical protein